MIVPMLARMIVREHLYKPINGTVLCLGRQTVAMTYEQTVELLKQENYSFSSSVLEETEKYDKKTRWGKDTNFISDEIFFNLLGIKHVSVMDVSSYEGADILHDLNLPVPESLEGKFDFIIDGGTFDHLLDLRTAFANVVKMLKPNGRVFQWNAASNFAGAAYVSLGPDLFSDYYVLNKFADCKIFIAEGDSFSQGELWDIYEFSGNDTYKWFQSDRILMTIVMAEKSPDSTSDQLPVQAQYRDEHLAQAYKDNQKIILASSRKPYCGSLPGMKITPVPGKNEANETILRKITSKCKEKGFTWVCRRCLYELANKVRRKYFPTTRGNIAGFKYVGKI